MEILMKPTAFIYGELFGLEDMATTVASLTNNPLRNHPKVVVKVNMLLYVHGCEVAY